MVDIVWWIGAVALATGLVSFALIGIGALCTAVAAALDWFKQPF